MKRKTIHRLPVSCCIIALSILPTVRASVVLTDFESAGDQSVEASPNGANGKAVITNACALSGARALWMGPHADKVPDENYGFAEVFWTNPAKRDWSRADRLVFDVANLSHVERDVVFYLYDGRRKKCKDARFSYPLKAGRVQRITVKLNWRKLDVDPKDVRGMAFVRCSPRYGAIVLDRLMLLEPGENPPPEVAAGFLSREAKAYAAYETPLEAADLRREDEKERLRAVAFRKQLESERPVQAERLRKFVADLRNGGRETGRMVALQASSMQQIRPRGTDFTKLKPATGLSLRLARGEYEGAQLAVASDGDAPLEDVSISVSGDFAGRLAVTAETVGFVLADAPLRHKFAVCEPCATNVCGYLRTCRETPLGWYADPILPYLDKVTVERGDVQSFYVRVKALETCPPGTYSGQVRIRAKGVPDRTVPLTVRVNAFEVGKTSALPLLVSFTPYVQPLSLSWTERQADAVRRDPNAPVNLWRRHRVEWSDFLGEYFILPSTIYPSRGDEIPDFDLIRRAFSRGRKGPFIVAPWSMCRKEADWRQSYLESLKKRYAAACAAGLGEYAMSYGCDEVTADCFEPVGRALDILKREAPEVPIITTAVDPDLGVDSPLAKVDEFCPLTTSWNPRKVAASRKAGHRVWWYVACGEVPPLANFFVESPLSEGRLLMGAQAFREKPDGFLYYAIAKWNTSRPLVGGPFTDWSPHGIRHRNEKAVDGDGVMTYCGPDGVPLATLRLENFRDGVEDYNYAALLERLYKAHADKTDAWAHEARRMLDVPLSVMESLRNFTDDPAAVYAWRDRMADLIEADMKAALLREKGKAELPEEALRMVPQDGAAMAVVTQEPRHVSIWDYNISPSGEHYFSVCSEGTVSDYARLYRYLPERNEVRRVFRLEDVSITRDEAVRPSKLHSSIDFLPDGRVIMATHTTAAAPNHPRWMPFAYYPDLWEGYPGSNILIYDPRTGKTEDLGVPVVHESVYGGIYEKTTHSYYFTGYHRGHIYRFDLATRKVTDFGQAVEYGTWRWVRAADGNLYTTTASGRLVRLNVARQRIEDVPFDFPIKPELMSLGTNNKMMHVAPDKAGFWFTSLSCDRLMRYDIGTAAVSVGKCFVPESLRDITPKIRCMGMCADETGMLWLLEEAVGIGQYLVSIDVAKDGEPVCHGLCGVPERAMGASFGCFVRDGVLYASDTNRGNDPPAVFQVPLAALRGGGKGPFVRDVRFYLRTKDGAMLYRRNTGRDLLADADRILGEGIAAEAERVSPERLATLPVYYREHPEVRFNGDLALNMTMLPHSSRWVCKLWKRFGHLDFTSLGFLEDGTVWVQAGATRYLMRNGELVGSEPAREIVANAALVRAKGARLPYQPERRHLCRATAACDMLDGRVLAGTQDGMLALLRANGKVFSCGSVGLGQTVHDLVPFPGGRRVLGVAGGPRDLGTVFTYDDEAGLVLHGRIFFQDHASPGVLGASSQPRLAAVSPDGRFAAIAVGDRMSCVYRFELKDEIVD